MILAPPTILSTSRSAVSPQRKGIQCAQQDFSGPRSPRMGLDCRSRASLRQWVATISGASSFLVHRHNHGSGKSRTFFCLLEKIRSYICLSKCVAIGRYYQETHLEFFVSFTWCHEAIGIGLIRSFRSIGNKFSSSQVSNQKEAIQLSL